MQYDLNQCVSLDDCPSCFCCYCESLNLVWFHLWWNIYLPRSVTTEYCLIMRLLLAKKSKSLSGRSEKLVLVEHMHDHKIPLSC